MERREKVSLVLLVAGVIGFLSEIGLLFYHNGKIKEAQREIPKRVQEVKREIYKIEQTSLIQLLISDPNIPQNIPELIGYHKGLISERKKYDSDPNIIDARKRIEKYSVSMLCDYALTFSCFVLLVLGQAVLLSIVVGERAN